MVDARGRRLVLERPARRIVSLVPSTTESLALLGAAPRVVGRTRYCVRPAPWVGTVPAVGGTKDVDLARVAALRPDLILANAEENRPEQFAALEALAPLHVALPRSLDDVGRDLLALGGLTGCAARGALLAGRLARERDALERRSPAPFRYVALVWRRPWRALGGDTYAAALLAALGGTNALGEGGPGRYPEVDPETLAETGPDLVLLPDEPYRFTAAHAAELGPLAPRCRLVDGELLFWHGARTLRALPRLARSLGPPAR